MPSRKLSTYLYGRHSRDGLSVALVVAMLDQALKLWLLFALDLAAGSPVRVLPFFDLVLTWNRGISYGLFRQDGPWGPWILLAFKIGAVALLWAWLAQASGRLTALALGLIIGGAAGNAIDRAAYGAVVDYAYLHLHAAGLNFGWYVFNLADAAIVVGVAILLYEVLRGERAAKGP
ncbi:MAG: signal peptidase II [Pseudorhodoplanes sp.]|nr:signal peptidase II [Pseudorhodoplanes sp.]